jgi:predicted dehydrogenase
MNVPPSALSEPVRVGLIGAGRIGTTHAEPWPAASSTAHTRLILAAIAAGKAVFCEKPMAETLEDADRVGGSHRSGLFT